MYLNALQDEPLDAPADVVSASADQPHVLSVTPAMAKELEQMEHLAKSLRDGSAIATRGGISDATTLCTEQLFELYGQHKCVAQFIIQTAFHVADKTKSEYIRLQLAPAEYLAERQGDESTLYAALLTPNTITEQLNDTTHLKLRMAGASSAAAMGAADPSAMFRASHAKGSFGLLITRADAFDDKQQRISGDVVATSTKKVPDDIVAAFARDPETLKKIEAAFATLPADTKVALKTLAADINTAQQGAVRFASDTANTSKVTLPLLQTISNQVKSILPHMPEAARSPVEASIKETKQAARETLNFTRTVQAVAQTLRTPEKASAHINMHEHSLLSAAIAQPASVQAMSEMKAVEQLVRTPSADTQPIIERVSAALNPAPQQTWQAEAHITRELPVANQNTTPQATAPQILPALTTTDISATPVAQTQAQVQITNPLNIQSEIVVPAHIVQPQSAPAQEAHRQEAPRQETQTQPQAATPQNIAPTIAAAPEKVAQPQPAPAPETPHQEVKAQPQQPQQALPQEAPPTAAPTAPEVKAEPAKELKPEPPKGGEQVSLPQEAPKTKEETGPAIIEAQPVLAKDAIAHAQPDITPQKQPQYPVYPDVMPETIPSLKIVKYAEDTSGLPTSNGWQKAPTNDQNPFDGFANQARSYGTVDQKFASNGDDAYKASYGQQDAKATVEAKKLTEAKDQFAGNYGASNWATGSGKAGATGSEFNKCSGCNGEKGCCSINKADQQAAIARSKVPTLDF